MNIEELDNIIFPNSYSTHLEKQTAIENLCTIHTIISRWYDDLLVHDLGHRREIECQYVQILLAKLDTFRFTNRSMIYTEHSVKTDDIRSLTTDFSLLAHKVICNCLLGLAICSNKIESTICATSFNIVKTCKLAMSARPILSYTMTELRDAVWTLAASWNDIVFVLELVNYVAYLELRYAMLLHCAYPGSVQNLKKYVIESSNGECICNESCMRFMETKFSTMNYILWIAMRYERQAYCPVESDAIQHGECVVRLIKLLYEFYQKTQTKDGITSTFLTTCIGAYVHIGDVERFAPENQLYPMDYHTVIQIIQGIPKHGAMCHRLSTPVLELIQDLHDRVCTMNVKTIYEIRLSMKEELLIIVLFNFICIRFGFPWAQRFVINRGEFLQAAELFEENLPLIVNHCNRYIYYHEKRYYECGSVLSSIIFWMEHMNEHNDCKYDGNSCKNIADVVLTKVSYSLFSITQSSLRFTYGKRSYDEMTYAHKQLCVSKS